MNMSGNSGFRAPQSVSTKVTPVDVDLSETRYSHCASSLYGLVEDRKSLCCEASSQEPSWWPSAQPVL